MLTGVHDSTEIRKALRKLHQRIIRETEAIDCKIGWPSGHTLGKVYWHKQLNLWFHFFQPKERIERDVIFVGIEPPSSKTQRNIVFELNIPLGGVNLRCGGAFAKDPAGRVYVTHNGKVGGGHKGVGKSRFLSWYGREQLREINWPDNRGSLAVVLGELSGPEFLSSISAYAGSIARFKEYARSGGGLDVAADESASYQPEFHGLKKYRLNQEIELNCRHGIVVEQLARLLYPNVANTKNIDLLVYNKDARPKAVIEVKTENDFSSFLKAVGQLLVYADQCGGAPVKVLVMPAGIDRKNKATLQRLGIRLVEYAWRKDKAHFLNLANALRLVKNSA